MDKICFSTAYKSKDHLSNAMARLTASFKPELFKNDTEKLNLSSIFDVSLKKENCSKYSNFYHINLFIENKDSHFGTFLLTVHPEMNLHFLKMQVEHYLGISTSAQKLIFCNKLIENDRLTLENCGILPNSSLFLYVDSSKNKFKSFQIHSDHNWQPCIEIDLLQNSCTVMLKSDLNDPAHLKDLLQNRVNVLKPYQINNISIGQTNFQKREHSASFKNSSVSIQFPQHSLNKAEIGKHNNSNSSYLKKEMLYVSETNCTSAIAAETKIKNMHSFENLEREHLKGFNIKEFSSMVNPRISSLQSLKDFIEKIKAVKGLKSSKSLDHSKKIFGDNSGTITPLLVEKHDNIHNDSTQYLLCDEEASKSLTRNLNLVDQLENLMNDEHTLFSKGISMECSEAHNLVSPDLSQARPYEKSKCEENPMQHDLTDTSVDKHIIQSNSIKENDCTLLNDTFENQTLCSSAVNLLMDATSILTNENGIETSAKCGYSENENSLDVNNTKQQMHSLCNKLEEDLTENYKMWQQIENLSLVYNVESFCCPICFQEIDSGEGIVLHECLHMFCCDCLQKTIEYSEDIVVNCPFHDEEYSCPRNLQHREIKALVSEHVYDRYLQRSVNAAKSNAEKSFHCKSPNCEGWCLFEDNLNIFHCPVCLHYNCLNCNAIHEGFNCKQYQTKLKIQKEFDTDSEKSLALLNKLIEDGKAMKCPKCDLILMKRWGCDWLKCSICLTEICWITKGPRWGPAGQGDTSAGCKCGVNGIKCHPSCTYCH